MTGLSVGTIRHVIELLAEEERKRLDGDPAVVSRWSKCRVRHGTYVTPEDQRP